MMKSFWHKIIGWMSPKSKSKLDNITTAPLSDSDTRDITRQLPEIAPQQLIVCSGQSVGKQRDHNEDSIFTFHTSIGGEATSQALGLFIVADGMGGHQYGEVASNVAVRSMGDCILRRFQPFLAYPPEILTDSLQDIMREGLAQAQRGVMKAAPGSGTTLTAALVLGNQLTIAHVGDSRAYSIQLDGRVDLLTRDHSLVKRLEELGQLSNDELASHPQRNVLYRALGQGEILEPDITTAPFPNNGFVLICSDGLWSLVTDEEIFHTVVEAPSLEHACQNLVSAANKAGGSDNISVIIVKLIG